MFLSIKSTFEQLHLTLPCSAYNCLQESKSYSFRQNYLNKSLQNKQTRKKKPQQ